MIGVVGTGRPSTPSEVAAWARSSSGPAVEARPWVVPEAQPPAELVDLLEASRRNGTAVN